MSIYPEQQYLNQLEGMHNLIINNGFNRMERTGTGAYSIFGSQMRFNLSDSFPLFTHKQVFMRGIFEELMWFLRGDTNIKTLLEKRVNIWNEWRYDDYLRDTDYISGTMGCKLTTLSMEEFCNRIMTDKAFEKCYGSIGKGYGHQWRNFGETEVETVGHNSRGDECQVVARLDGFDQISWVINEIKTNPTSRRLIVSGWNPHDVDHVDLPPCHTLFQFFVDNGKLSCQLYQRSADLLLGVPFNIASYALLTHLVALECGLEVGEFIWTGGDCHVYANQMAGLNEIVHNRNALPPPQIKIKKRESIFDYEWDDIEIVGYNHMGKIEIPVAV